MTPDTIVALGREATMLTFSVAGPILGVILVTGLTVSLFQAVTQIQEMTLTFVPKVLAVAALLTLLGNWMLGRLVGFTTELLTNLPMYAR